MKEFVKLGDFVVKDEVYDSAIDVETAPYVYVETNEKIEIEKHIEELE